MKRCKHKGRYFKEGGETPKETPIGSYLSIGTTLLPGIINLLDGGNDSDSQRIKSLGETYRDDINQLANTQFAGSNASLAKQSTMLPVWENLDMEDFGGSTNAGASLLSGALSGASSAVATGNPWIIGGSALVGGLTGLFNASDSNRRKRREINSLNQAGLAAENRMRNNFNTAIGTTDARNDRWRMQNMYNTNYAAFGGLLETNGANWETGATFINNGGTHQANPFGGVQFGVASDGLPNMVEEGEIIIKVKDNPNNQHSFAYGGSPTYSDYVVSAREDMAPNLQEITDAKITDNPEYYVGWAPARIYEDITKKNHIHEVPNRQDTKDYIDSFNERFASMQEATRTRKEQEQLMERLKKATPEEQDYIMQDLGMQQPMQGEYLGEQYANGGSIHIAPSKKWHQTGGYFNTAGTSGIQVNNDWIVPSSSYRQASAFNNILDSEGNYLPGYVDWVKNLTQEDYDYLSTLPGFDKKLNGSLATLKRRATDKMFENTHAWMNSLYRPAPAKTETIPEIAEEYIPANTNPESIPIRLVPEGTPVTLNTPNDSSMYVFSNAGNESILYPAEENNYLLSEIDRNVYPAPNIINAELLKSQDKEGLLDEEKNTSIPNGVNTDWILPDISGANVIADALGITNRPDYSNARRIERAILPPNLIDYNPNGRYAKPLLTDRNYVATILANQGTAAINAAQNLSGNNSATALYNIALNNHLNNQAIGQALAQTDEANNETIRQTVATHNAVDRANAEGAFNADRANQSILEDYARRYAAQRTAGAQLRETIDNQVATNRSANWNNFLENLQGVFENQRNRELANAQYGVYGYGWNKNGNKYEVAYSPSMTTKQKERAYQKALKEWEALSDEDKKKYNKPTRG